MSTNNLNEIHSCLPFLDYYVGGMCRLFLRIWYKCKTGFAALKSWSLIFYGTAIPVDKNDPMPVRPTANTPTYSSPSASLQHQAVYNPPNSNQYPVSILTKPNSKSKANPSTVPLSGGGSGGPGGRKQQQGHRISPYGTILTTPRKNGKNSKNHSQSNAGKSNTKGNTSNRPVNSQTVGQQPARNNFYRLQTSASGGQSSTGSTRQSLTTSKPKNGNQQSIYNTNSGSNRGSSSSSTYKSDKSRAHEKVAVKAPKQIKDNNAYGVIVSSTANPTSITPQNTRYEPNPRIPKLFQQYDKIEQIFPEFHPYTGGGIGTLSRDNVPPTKPAPNKKQYPYYPNSGNTFQNSNTNNRGGGRSNNSGNGRSEGTSVVVVATNPKPSRENAKKFSSTSSLSTLSSSQNLQNAERERQTEGIYIPNRKNVKGIHPFCLCIFAAFSFHLFIGICLVRIS